MEDQRIVELLWKRSEHGIQALQKKFSKTLHRIAMNILGDPRDAEEAENDTYLALWDAIPPARPDPLTAFVCRICRNISLNLLRSQTAQKRDHRYDLCLEELMWVLPGNSAEQDFDARELGRAIDRFLDTLEPQSRILFLRRYWFGDDIARLSRQQHMSTGAVTVRLHRIRSKLKHYLIKEGFLYEA